MPTLDWIGKGAVVRHHAVGELWAEMSFVMVTDKQWGVIEAKLTAG